MLNRAFVLVAAMTVAVVSIEPFVMAPAWTESQRLVLFGLSLYLVAGLLRLGNIRANGAAHHGAATVLAEPTLATD